MFAVLSNLFVGSALFPVTSICVGLKVFVHWLKVKNPDSQMEFKNPGFRADCFLGGGFGRVTLGVGFVTFCGGLVRVSGGLVTVSGGLVTVGAGIGFFWECFGERRAWTDGRLASAIAGMGRTERKLGRGRLLW
jgi:hypothetical protein